MKSSRRIRLEVLALIAAAGCAGGPALPPPPAATLPATVDPVDIDDETVSILAELLRMEDRRTLDEARIRTFAQHPSRLVRGHAVMAIGRVRDRALAPVALAALGDEAPIVRAQAAFALGLLADSSDAALIALSTVLDESGDIDPRPGIEAAAALGRIGTDGAFAALRERVAASGASPDAPGDEALLHLWRAPRSAAILSAVTPLLASPDAETRWNAAYALARAGGADAVAPLLPLVADSAHDVRALAFRALRAPAVDSAALREPALAALHAGLRDVHPHVRINALGAIASFGAAADADSVARLAADADGNVRMAAIQALGAVGGTRVAATLDGIVRAEGTGVGIRAGALTALARIAPPDAIPHALAWAASPDWLMRLHATRTLVSLGDVGGARSSVLARARDPDARVAAVALRALGEQSDEPAAHALLIERLASSDAAVRAAAVTALARIPRAPDLALLMEAYERARHDSVPAAALAVIDALAALERDGVPAARSFFLRFPPSDDVRVRRRVAERFGDDRWGPLAEPPAEERPESFYRDAVTRLMVPALTGQARPRVAIGTDMGEIIVALTPEHAPLTVLNFLTLIESGYYLGDDYGGNPSLRWHRVVPNFVLQDGDPRGDGSGNPGYAIRDEINRLRYARGVVGMALSGPDTGGGQYFITHSPQPHLDGGYTIFGRVLAGMDVADRVVQDDPIHYIRIVQ